MYGVNLISKLFVCIQLAFVAIGLSTVTYILNLSFTFCIPNITNILINDNYVNSFTFRVDVPFALMKCEQQNNHMKTLANVSVREYIGRRRLWCGVNQLIESLFVLNCYNGCILSRESKDLGELPQRTLSYVLLKSSWK